MRAIGLVFVFFTITGLLLAPPNQDLGTLLSLIVVPGLVAIAALTGLIALPLCWLTLRRRRDIVEAPITFTVDDTGIQYATSLYASRVTWQFVRRVRDADRYLFFDNGAGTNQFVPKGAFDGPSFDALTRLLLAKLPGSPVIRRDATFLSRYGSWLLVIAAGALVAIVAVLQLGTESPASLRVGDCYDRPAFGTLDSITRRSCTEPHDAEMITALTIPARPSDPYPGEDGFTRFTMTVPLEELEAYLRADVDPADLTIGAQFPSEAAWELGDRLVMVYAHSALNGKLTTAVRALGAPSSSS